MWRAMSSGSSGLASRRLSGCGSRPPGRRSCGGRSRNVGLVEALRKSPTLERLPAITGGKQVVLLLAQLVHFGGTMTPRELKERTAKFAHAIIAFCTPLLTIITATDLARQLLRAGTAVDSNYGSAQRARSHREFTSRIGVVFDEASESLGWLQLLEPSDHAKNEEFRWLLNESEELTRIFNKAYETARAKEEAERKKRRQRGRRRDQSPSDESPDPTA